MLDAGRQCEYTKPDGTRCRARALANGPHCFFHAEETAEARQSARRRGGKTRSKAAAVLPTDTPDVPLATVGDVVSLLAMSINEVRKGAIDAKVANATGYLAGVLLRAMEESELAEQVRQLRDEIERLKHGDGNLASGGSAAGPGTAPPNGDGAGLVGGGPPEPGPDHDPGGNGAGRLAGPPAAVGLPPDVAPLFPPER
jgi:hypothetical protein